MRSGQTGELGREEPDEVKQKEHRVLLVGRSNCIHQYRLGDDLLERSSEEEDLCVLVESRLAVSQQCAFVAKNGTMMA